MREDAWPKEATVKSCIVRFIQVNLIFAINKTTKQVKTGFQLMHRKENRKRNIDKERERIDKNRQKDRGRQKGR